MNKVTQKKTRHILIKALKGILRPLIRLLIQHQITFPALRELLKEVYVEVANEIIQRDGELANNSRIYILTGVHRKDIRRIFEQQPDDNDLPADLSLGGAVIASWTANSEYLDKQGMPRALKKTGLDDEPGFEQLVASVSKDVRPRALLDEWMRQGLISLQQDQVVLNEKAFIPSEDFEKLCFYLERNIRDHIATATHNLLKEGEPMLERSVYYGKLTEESVQHLREQANEMAMNMLTEINQQAMQRLKADTDKDNANSRFTLGCYWHEQEKTS
jgi:hypothetical protein